MFSIVQDDLSNPQTRELLAIHLAEMHAHSPPGQVFALDLRGLQSADVTVWTAWDGTRIVAIGALRQISRASGEIKSMRTHPAYVRRGGGAALLETMIAEARRRGLTRLSLETGSGPAFEPALALYRGRGFVEGDAFAEYVRSEFNRFFHLAL